MTESEKAFVTSTGRALRVFAGGRAASTPIGRERRPSSDIRDAVGQARGRHAYLLGQPGVGKSTLCQEWIAADLLAGRGALVLDPHGTLAEAIVETAPPDLASRILLVDPGDTEFPFGLNVLEASDPETQDRVVQFMIDLFMTLYLPDQQGPMLHQAIRNGLRLLMATGGVLPELPMIFTDKTYLRRLLEGVLESVNDPWVLHYFEQVWLPWGTDKDGFMAYLTSKLSPFVEDRILRNILGQPRGLDLATALDRSCVVVINLSPARIGALNARLLGMLLLHQLDQAIRRRGPHSAPVRIYVDELHEVVTPGFPAMLAAARKFGVGYVVAHQGLEQLPGALAAPLLEAVGTVVAFRQGLGPGAGQLADLFWPRFRERDLLGLSDFQAVVRTLGPGGKPQMGRLTLDRPLPRVGGSGETVRANSRSQIARPRTEVEADLLRRVRARNAQ